MSHFSWIGLKGSLHHNAIYLTKGERDKKDSDSITHSVERPRCHGTLNEKAQVGHHRGNNGRHHTRFPKAICHSGLASSALVCLHRTQFLNTGKQQDWGLLRVIFLRKWANMKAEMVTLRTMCLKTDCAFDQWKQPSRKVHHLSLEL